MNEIKYKQYIIIPKRPKMSKGKIASQVCHASFMALENQRAEIDKARKIKPPEQMEYTKHITWLHEWKNTGMCVIVLECKSQIELMNIAKYCEQWKVPSHLYIDEGITEIPMGTATAFATGALPEEYFWMFSQLKLFRG